MKKLNFFNATGDSKKCKKICTMTREVSSEN